jgi:hypothetical protein
MFRRICSAIAVAAVAMAFTGSAVQAAAPIQTTEVSSGSGLLADCGGGVTLTETYDLRVMTSVWVEENVDPTRISVKNDFLGIITNSASGNTYRDPAHFTNTVDLAEHPAFNGLVYHIIVRGTGPVVSDVGRLVFDGQGGILLEGGPHMVADGTAPDPCTVLI